jgi:glycosyltransferase involved in cell wall biosynthesis
MSSFEEGPEISVIIPARNAASTLGAQLDALSNQEYEGAWEVVVVDDCSTDATEQVALSYRDRLPALRVVHTVENRNAAVARNVGVAAASGRHLLFCDADDIVGDGYLSAMAEALREEAFVAACMDVARLNPPWVYGRRGNRQVHSLHTWEVNRRPYLEHAGAGTVGLRRELYDELGLFDESLEHCHGPGPEYCFRAQLAGYGIHLVPDAVVHLRLRPTLRTIYRQSRDWAEWSVALEKKFISSGMPPSGWLRGLAGWALVLPRLLGVRDRADLVWWVRYLAWRVGRVRGSIRFRMAAL